MNMTKTISNSPRGQSINRVSGMFSCEQQRQQILKAAEEQFAATGFGSASTATVAKAAGVSEATLYIHFGTKQELFEEVLKRNTQDRLAALRKRFFSIPNMPPLECIESLAESTVLACVDDIANASVMAWGLMEMPEFAADVYRVEIGATEALWDSEIGKRFGKSPVRTRLAVHLVPYAVHACMAFGLWLATLRHKPETAEAHARQYAGGIVDIARVALSFLSEPFVAEASRSRDNGEFCTMK
jgi:AcrR family transcriptional regulator